MSFKTISLLILFLIAVVVAVASGRLGTRDDEAPPIMIDNESFYMRDFVLTQYDTTGTRIRSVSGASLRQNETSGESKLELPQTLIFDNDTATWQINADTGHINSQQTIIALDSSVVARHLSSDGTQLRTEHMDIDLVKKTASSDDNVSIEHNSGLQTGDGMRASLTDNRIQLLRNIRGTYHNDH